MTTPPEADAIPDDVAKAASECADRIACGGVSDDTFRSVTETEIARAIMQDRRTRNAPGGEAEVLSTLCKKLVSCACSARQGAAKQSDTGSRNVYLAFADQLESYAAGAKEALATPPAPAASPSGGAVAVKPLEWRGPDLDDEYHARSIIGTFYIGYGRKDGSRWCMGEYHPSLDEAKAAAQADYERRIRSALSAPAAPDGEVVRVLRSQVAKYDEWMLDDDYDAAGLLHEIMDVMKAALAKIGGGHE